MYHPERKKIAMVTMITYNLAQGKKNHNFIFPFDLIVHVFLKKKNRKKKVLFIYLVEYILFITLLLLPFGVKFLSLGGKTIYP